MKWRSVSAGNKRGSGNWHFELGLAVAIREYSPAPNRPIGIFHRIDHQICRYTVLVPANEILRDCI